MTKADLHQLVDRLPDGAVDGALAALEERAKPLDPDLPSVEQAS